MSEKPALELSLTLSSLCIMFHALETRYNSVQFRWCDTHTGRGSSWLYVKWAKCGNWIGTLCLLSHFVWFCFLILKNIFFPFHSSSWTIILVQAQPSPIHYSLSPRNRKLTLNTASWERVTAVDTIKTYYCLFTNVVLTSCWLHTQLKL